MLSLKDIRKEYDRLDKILNISTKDIPIKYMSGFSCGGVCRTERNTGKVHDIKLNKILFECPDEEILDVARHEYAHAANNIIHNGVCDSHGPQWQEICVKIGCSPERLINSESQLSRKLDNLREKSIKYEITCPHCGNIVTYTKLSRIVKSYYNGFPLVCGNCGLHFQKDNNAFYCLVVGSHTFEDYELLKKKLDVFLSEQKEVVIVSGKTKGVDSLAERYAKEKGCKLKIFRADWDKHGKKARYVCNEEMHKYISQFPKRGLVAFWDGKSKGIAQNFELCAKYQTPYKIVRF